MSKGEFKRMREQSRTRPPVESLPFKVTVPAEPTDDQLANFAAVLGFPLFATPMFRKMPHWRQSMLNLHALGVRMLNGDEEATRIINFMLHKLNDDDIKAPTIAVEAEETP